MVGFEVHTCLMCTCLPEIESIVNDVALLIDIRTPTEGKTMMTSNFKTMGHDLRAISIAGYAPDNFIGRQYRNLAPKRWFFDRYKQDGDETFYREQFQKLVLDPLNPRTVFNELGADSILLCWEHPNQFCHRHIVAEWFRSELGVMVPEYQRPNVFTWGSK
jgi:hypothetical protein